MGETRVDLLHLLEDIRDAYPGALEETILTEIVANSLDSGATSIAFATNPADATFTVVDDGSGMVRRDLARYHDVAATTKTKGQGIGFAGVGIKLGLLLCEEVLTETRRASRHVASLWHLAARHRAPWKWVPPPGLVVEHGTAVRLKLKNALSPLLEGGFIETTLHRHFQPLLDSTFDDLLARHYPRGVRFLVNGRPLERRRPASGHAPLAIRIGRRRKPSAVGYLVREASPLAEAERGVAVSTLGKVIKRGWDWLGLSPAMPEHVGGLVEVPALAECLTLNKADFIRHGPKGGMYLAYRKAVQEAVSAQFAAWGDARDAIEETRRRKTRPLERDLGHVLEDLVEDFPLLASLVERCRGGQKELPMGRPGGAAAADAPVSVGSAPDDSLKVAGPQAGESPGAEASEAAGGPSTPERSQEHEQEQRGEDPADSQGAAETSFLLPGRPGPRRPMRYGITLQFESRPEDPGLGRFVESTVWVNDAHPAYRRALASRSDGYHLALTVAMTLAPLAVESSDVHAFVSAFLVRWGQGRS